MRAAFYECNGRARDVLRVAEVQTPHPDAGEVRVKLAVSGANPSDVKSRQGTTRKIAWPRVIPHSDGAGVIDEVGAGVPQTRLNERVWVWNGQWKRPFGTAAEYVVLPVEQAVPLPHSVSFGAGACLGIPAMTASHALALARLQPGIRILISGGAGAVSQYAIQFAKKRGATVLTTISSPQKAQAARDAGADHCIDYKREDVSARMRELTGGALADCIIELDLTANAKLIPSVLRPKGRVIVYGTGVEATVPASFCLVNSIGLQFFLVYELDAAERAAALAGIAENLPSLKHRIAEPAYTLEQIAEAHEAVERGTLGNVVVRI